MAEKVTPIQLDEAEHNIAEHIAAETNLEEEECASQLVKAAIARRMKERTGFRPAKVYDLKRK